MSLALAIIGGTGVYALERLDTPERLHVETAFADAPVEIVRGSWQGHPVAFLARHGAGHTVLPHEVNYRANLWALKQLAPARVVALNAVGSLDERLPPQALALPDQLIDYTYGRESTFYGDAPGIPMHVDVTEPYDGALRAELTAAAADDLAASDDVVYGATQGPRLETAAEIRRLARDGCHVVGMTGMPEAALARELNLPYASLSLVANWAAGFKPDQPEITLDEVFENLGHATAKAWQMLERLLASL